MKVLFAVSNEKISESIAKKYQQEYKEIISSKNVYYFNAIIKELQKDKSYDRIVISEDLEMFSSNNYQEIDKFIFEKLDNISDEAVSPSGNDIPIILISADRRTKMDPLMIKLFGIGIYSALLGQDRSIQKVCDLIYKPRSKKEAKAYYRVESENVDYKTETINNNGVNEVEIENILAHYRRIGENPAKCVESFKKIAAQYTEEQLRLIVSVLPIEVKMILEANSKEYVNFAKANNLTIRSKAKNTDKKVATKQTQDFVETKMSRTKLSNPVIIPTQMDTSKIKKIGQGLTENSEKRRLAQQAAEERAKRIAQRKAMEEKARIEAERKVAEEKRKRKIAEEKARQEAERKVAEEKARREAERKAAQERARKEAEKKAAQEKARIEAERKAAEEKARREAERKAAQEKARKEAEKKAAQEKARKEAERKAAEERARKEAERKAAEERARKEAERKAAQERARKEAERKAAQERARKEAERKAAQEKARKEAERKAAEERERKEAERKAAQEKTRREAERRAEQEKAKKEAEIKRIQEMDKKEKSSGKGLEDMEEQGRKRGRPRKNPAEEKVVTTEKRGRGRPRKETSKEETTQNAEKKRRGRPRKETEELNSNKNKTKVVEIEEEDIFAPIASNDSLDSEFIDFDEFDEIDAKPNKKATISKPKIEDDYDEDIEELPLDDDNDYEEVEDDYEDEELTLDDDDYEEVEDDYEDEELPLDDDDYEEVEDDYEDEELPLDDDDDYEEVEDDYEDEELPLDDDDDYEEVEDDYEDEELPLDDDDYEEVEDDYEDEELPLDDDDDEIEPDSENEELPAEDEDDDYDLDLDLDFDDEETIPDEEEDNDFEQPVDEHNEEEEEIESEDLSNYQDDEEDEDDSLPLDEDDDLNIDEDLLLDDDDIEDEEQENQLTNEKLPDYSDDFQADEEDDELPLADEDDNDNDLFGDEDEDLFDDEDTEMPLDDEDENDDEDSDLAFDDEDDDNMLQKIMEQDNIGEIQNKNLRNANNINARNLNIDIDDEEPEEQFTSNSTELENTNNKPNLSIDNLITGNKKVVSFIGTSKNGTSFIVNNLAKMFSEKGIKTALLDLTQNRNAYYIYTENEEELRKKAYSCLDNLKKGITDGIQVNKNLTVYTSLPGETESLKDGNSIMETLLKEYSLVLLDCDFNTNPFYFKVSQEIYLVQSLDVLTIQPLTAFLRELKVKNMLESEKLRIIINKAIKVNGITEKILIGGMSVYNDPGMTYMTELFDRNKIKYTTIPFEEQIYANYLESLAKCKITYKGASKKFLSSLNTLGNMVYPLLNGRQTKKDAGFNNFDNNFSADINTTLSKMKSKY